MANPYRIRAASVFIDSRKVATAKDGSLDEDGGDEDVITDGGWSGMSDGANTSKLKLNVVKPVTGETATLEDAFYNKKYLRIEVTPIDGRIKTITMRCTKVGTNWNHKTGMSDGGFEFSGGQATPT